MANTTDILKGLVPKCCKMVDGRLKGGFVNWEGEEGQAVNKALLALALVDELDELGFCHNYQHERSDLVEWIESVGQIIKDIRRMKGE